MRSVVSVNVSPNYILVVSLAILIACKCRLFSSFMNIACRSTQKCRAYQTLYKISHRYNRNHWITKNNNNKFAIILKRNYTKVHSNTRSHHQLALEMRTGWPHGWFWKYLNGFARSPRFGSSWKLTKCNLSWKIVKYRILSEVCMINSTVSPQICCIKSIKCWFTHHQICGILYSVDWTGLDL